MGVVPWIRHLQLVVNATATLSSTTATATTFPSSSSSSSSNFPSTPFPSSSSSLSPSPSQFLPKLVAWASSKSRNLSGTDYPDQNVNFNDHNDYDDNNNVDVGAGETSEALAPEVLPYYAYYSDVDDGLDLTSSGGLNLLFVAALVAGIIAFALCCTCVCTCCFSYGKEGTQGLSSEEVKRWNDQMRVIEPYCSSRVPEGGGWSATSPTDGAGRRSGTASLYGGDDDGEGGDNVSVSNASSIGIGNGIGKNSGALNNNNSNNKKSGQKKGGGSKSSKK